VFDAETVGVMLMELTPAQAARQIVEALTGTGVQPAP
jgi:hypothetical protein